MIFYAGEKSRFHAGIFMEETLRILCVGLVVFCTFTLESIAGFGSTVLALPFIIMLIGMRFAVPFLSLLGLLLAAFVVMRSWRQFRVREYLFIVFHVGLGIPLGIYLMEKLPKQQLIALLVLFMFIVGIRGLVSLWQARKNREELATGAPAKNLLMRLVLFFGGIIHGAFTTGGPFVIIYASRALPQKAEFRGTLSSLWLTTNIVMLIRWFTTGVIFESALLKTLLYALPFVIGGMSFGDYLHRRVNEYYFKVLVYSVLLVSAALLLCREIIFA